MRHTKGHTGNRRSHHGLKEPALSTCQDCGAKHVRHQVCMECGKYRGRQVVDVASMKEHKRLRKEAKERAIGEVTGQAQTKEEDAEKEAPPKPLSAKELSKK